MLADPTQLLAYRCCFIVVVVVVVVVVIVVVVVVVVQQNFQNKRIYELILIQISTRLTPQFKG